MRENEGGEREGTPIKVVLELWPHRLGGRVTVYKDGKQRDIAVSAPLLAVLIGWAKQQGII